MIRYRLTYKSILDLALIVAMTLVLVSGGCTSTRHSTTTESSTQPAATTTTTVAPTAGTVQNQTTTTTTEAHETHEPHSILGAIFYAVGEVVALPFKLIGGLFDFIF